MPTNVYAYLKCLDIMSFFDQMTSTDNYFLDFLQDKKKRKFLNSKMISWTRFQEEGFKEFFDSKL